MIPILLALLAQSDRLPPANPLPPPGTEEAAVMAPVQAVLDAIPTRNKDAVMAQLLPGGSATVAVERRDGTRTVRRMTWDEWGAGMKPGPERFVETQGMPAIEVDGDMAMVWAPYRFTVDGKLSHCGYNHYSLVRDAGRWRIASIAWTQRYTGCE
jgi:hypothetical protein